MRQILLKLWLAASLALPVGACAAPAASGPVVHVNLDAEDDHGARLAEELEAAGLAVPSGPETIDPMVMPFVSQVRYYAEADKAAAERALPVVQRYRPRAVLVLGEEDPKPGRIDVFLSRQDFDGSGAAYQAPPTERRPEPPSITDEAFRLVFDPEDRSTDPMKSAPAPAKAFFAAAKRADAIADPVQRCLAQPDLPGSQWSPAVVRALCEYWNTPVLTVAEARAFVARNDAAGLDARLAAGDREALYRVVEAIGAADDAGDITTAWRRQAPDSPYALAAQAAFLKQQAWRARTDQVAADVSGEQFASTRATAGRAIAAAQEAVRLDPKLLPAWIQLVELGQLTGDPGLVESAYRSGAAVDADSYMLNVTRMNALRPRWGGRFGDMVAFAATMRARADGHPLLAIVAAMPAREQGLVAKEADDFPAMAEVLRPLVAQVPDPGSFKTLGEVYPQLVGDGRWAGLAYEIEAARFGECPTCTRVALARDIRGIGGDLDWGVAILERVLREQPDDRVAQLELGNFRSQQGRYPEAIALLEGVLATEHDAARRHDALALLAEAARLGGKKALADKYAKQMAEEDAGR